MTLQRCLGWRPCFAQNGYFWAETMQGSCQRGCLIELAETDANMDGGEKYLVHGSMSTDEPRIADEETLLLYKHLQEMSPWTRCIPAAWRNCVVVTVELVYCGFINRVCYC